MHAARCVGYKPKLISSYMPCLLFQLTRRVAPAIYPCLHRARVEAACREIGGQLVEAGQEARSSSLGSHRFSFSFLAVRAVVGRLLGAQAVQQAVLPSPKLSSA